MNESTNPLLKAPPRRVVRVETPSRPDLTLYVGAVSGWDFMQAGSRASKDGESADFTALQLEMYVCDENGQPLLAPGEGVAFMKAIEHTDMRALTEAGDALNRLNDETIEEAEKKS